MGKILKGLSDESVWLKSLAEHDNVDKFVQLICSASNFNHTLSSQIPFIFHHKNTMCPLCPKDKRYMVKVYSFQENWGMADSVDYLLNSSFSPCILEICCIFPTRLANLIEEFEPARYREVNSFYKNTKCCCPFKNEIYFNNENHTNYWTIL